MFDRTACGIDLGRCERHDCVHFTCPCCGAEHDRGWVGYIRPAHGAGVFRCLRCGYSGRGLHPDPEIDCELADQWATGNTWNRDSGIAEVPLGTDPLNGPG
jgi:hypothetical protein